MKGSKLIFVFAILVLVLAACTSANATDAPTQPAVATDDAVVAATLAPATEAVPTSQAATAQPEPASGTVNLYTSEPEDKVAEMVADFNTLYPDVTVNVFRSGTGEVIAKIQAEQQAGAILADIIWFADDNFFKNLAEQDLMMEYRPVGSDAVDEMYHYNGDKYQEVRLIFNVIAYNTAAIKTPPSTWNDLLNPEYKGKVGMPSALYSGAAFNQVGTFANLPGFGWDFFSKLNENGVIVERGNGAVATKLASGEFVIGQLVDFMARDQKNAGSPVDHVWPKEGALLIPTPIGILKSAQNPVAAQAFLDYMYTDQAQNLFAKQGYISVYPNIAPPAGTPDMSNFKVLMPDEQYISAHRDDIRSKFEELYGAPAD